MSRFDFEVCGSAVRLEGDAKTLRHAQTLFQHMATDTAFQRCHFVSIKPSRIEWTRADGSTRGYDLTTGRLMEVALGALVASVIAYDSPETVLLHGNGLVNGRTGKALLLIGDSGSGKTTLTRELIFAGRWSPVAEDMLAIDMRKRQLRPFPRAMSRRVDGSEEKELDEFPLGNVKPVSVAECEVVLLQGPNAPVLRREPRWVLWMTSVTGRIAETAEASGAQCDALGGFHRILLPLTATGDERAALMAVCGEEGALVVHSGPEDVVDRALMSRPPKPEVSVADASGSLPLVGKSAIRPWVPERPQQPAGEFFMSMARLFHDAAFVHATPGGSPHDTVQALQSVVSRSNGSS